MRPTEKDIKKTTTGYYQLDCDGRHHHNHMYLYYTKKEIMKLWRKEHPINNTEEDKPRSSMKSTQKLNKKTQEQITMEAVREFLASQKFPLDKEFPLD